MYLPQLQKKVTVNQSVRKPTTSVDRAHAWPCQNIGREGMLRRNHREMQIWTTMENWLSSGMKESDGIEFQHVNKISMFAPEWKQNCIEAYVYVYIYTLFMIFQLFDHLLFFAVPYRAVLPWLGSFSSKSMSYKVSPVFRSYWTQVGAAASNSHSTPVSTNQRTIHNSKIHGDKMNSSTNENSKISQTQNRLNRRSVKDTNAHQIIIDYPTPQPEEMQ